MSVAIWFKECYMARSHTPEREAVWWPCGAEEDSGFCEGHRSGCLKEAMDNDDDEEEEDDTTTTTTTTAAAAAIATTTSLLVRAPDSWSKGCEFESRQERRESFLLQSQLCVLTLIRCPFHPRVTAVARKRPRLFCQKCRWQVTPKHAYTFHPTKSEPLWTDPDLNSG